MAKVKKCENCPCHRISGSGKVRTMQNTNTLNQLDLTTKSLPEVYAGKLTGETVWHTQCHYSLRASSVLGRGSSAQASVADWYRRARDDGYQV